MPQGELAKIEYIDICSVLTRKMLFGWLNTSWMMQQEICFFIGRFPVLVTSAFPVTSFFKLFNFFEICLSVILIPVFLWYSAIRFTIACALLVLTLGVCDLLKIIELSFRILTKVSCLSQTALFYW